MTINEQQQIFDAWLKNHQGLFFKVVRAYAFTPHDQEDLFQEISAKVWHSIPKFRNEAKETTWIYRVALYTAIAWSKKERRYRDQHRSIQGTERPLLVEKERHPQVDWLYDQIALLDEVERSLTLMMLDGHSYKDIATTLGITESNVGVKLNRIKKKLCNNHQKEESNEL